MPDTPKYFVVGLTHIDLAWKKDREEHEELLEAATVRLLDVLDNHPKFTYIIEQAAHYRSLAQRRPDLIVRLKSYIAAGRIEFVGGLASTLETNGPSGESFVRNQLLGLRCVRELFGTTIRTGYLIDTFGLNAQVPQILRQFGFETLLANRFGGILEKDTFFAVGLDGSRILVAGRDVNSGYVAWDRVFFGFVQENKHIKEIFDTAAITKTEGPCLVMPYTEYDGIASTYIGKLLEEKSRTSEGKWAFATASQFFDALTQSRADWPEYGGDLNPEFTGTFGLRVELRKLHRRAENLLLDSETWASLLALQSWQAEITEAWWKMAFAQSHDVYSGSHPTTVYNDTMDQLGLAAGCGIALLGRCANELGSSGKAEERSSRTEPEGPAILAMSSLPFERDAIVSFPLPDGLNPERVVAVLHGENALPFDVENRQLTFRASFRGISAKRFTLKLDRNSAKPSPPLAAPARQEPSASISNEYMTITADLVDGLKIRLPGVDGGDERTIGLELVVQEDSGSFQIERFEGSEVSSRVSLTAVGDAEVTPLKKRLVVRGRFPSLWMENANPLEWEMSCVIYSGKRQIDVFAKLLWHGNATRVRLKVSTGAESSTGIFEVPFGAVRRTPYQSRRTARGEWPVHRWVAVEEQGHGVALINRGSMGAEVLGGAICTTLLRAPTAEYSGMVADDTSSQHGEHDFQFAVFPYEGSWTDARGIEVAQDANSPVHCVAVPDGALLEASYLRLEPSTVVLSCVKSPEDETPKEVIVRFYEATGHQTKAAVFVEGARRAWLSDLNEARGNSLECKDGVVALMIEPFAIVTLRVLRDR